MSTDNMRFPANSDLAGKNAQRQQEITRQNHFGGLFCFEFNPRTNHPYQ
ncbi:hypothetical protein SAMN05216375_13315 [Trichococcus ilyis]|uniref:Uncharacterized protein n=1 Tax=Trichococcus ilyis TaxID=640938 RepID=A0A143Z7F1_9LACT|nr:Hypothetical protein TR210_2811 [Trichococcus ilyis]SEJ87070.1 hypothetical protein SAMN05216375_13315 [Trichococcus ilyis]